MAPADAQTCRQPTCSYPPDLLRHRLGTLQVPARQHHVRAPRRQLPRRLPAQGRTGCPGNGRGVGPPLAQASSCCLPCNGASTSLCRLHTCGQLDVKVRRIFNTRRSPCHCRRLPGRIPGPRRSPAEPLSRASHHYSPPCHIPGRINEGHHSDGHRPSCREGAALRRRRPPPLLPTLWLLPDRSASGEFCQNDCRWLEGPLKGPGERGERGQVSLPMRERPAPAALLKQ